MNIPQIIYGTCKYTENMQSLVETAIRVGVNGFDSATVRCYHEKELGQALEKVGLDRSKIWLQTKFTPNHAGGNPISYYPDHQYYDKVMQSFRWSLATLKTDYLDSYMVHVPTHFPREDKQIWKAMEDLYKSGQVDYIGYSHLSESGLQALVENSDVKPSFIQNHFSIFDQNQHLVFLDCLLNDITYQPFGFFSAQADTEEKKHIKKVIMDVAQKYNASYEQTFLKFLQEVGMQPLFTSASEDHIYQDANINFSLTAEDIKAISMATPNPDYYDTVYSLIKDGTFVRKQDFIDKIISLKQEELSDYLEKMKAHIEDIDPTSLAKIICAQTIEIIPYLKQYGALFSKINSKYLAEIVKSKGENIIDLLQNELNITAEKLLIAAAQLDNKEYFDKLLPDSNLTLLSVPELLQILKARSDMVEYFMNSEIRTENLLILASMLGQQNYVDKLFAKSEISSLDSYDIVNLILHEGKDFVKKLYAREAQFCYLLNQDYEILLSNLGIEILEELDRTVPDISHKLFQALVFMGYDKTEFFAKISEKSDLSKLNNSELNNLLGDILRKKDIDLFTKVADMVDFSIFTPNDNMDLLTIAAMLKDQNLFTALTSKVDVSNLYVTNRMGLFLDVLQLKDADFLSFMAAKLDISNVDHYYLGFLVKDVVKLKDSSLLNALLSNVDLSQMSDFLKEEIFNHAQQLGDEKLLSLLVDKMGPFSKEVDEQEILNSLKELLKKEVSNNEEVSKIDDELSNYSADSRELDELDQWDKKELILNTLKSGDQEKFNVLISKLDLSKIEDAWKIILVRDTLQLNDQEAFNLLTSKLDLSQFDEFFKQYLIIDILKLDDQDSFNFLLSKLDLSQISDYRKESLVKEARELGNDKLFAQLVDKIGLFSFDNNDFAVSAEDSVACSGEFCRVQDELVALDA